MRRLILVLAVAALVGAAIAWVLTMPARIEARALGPHTVDLANGRTMFLAGGCASCHAPPGGAADNLGGGLELPTPAGTFVVPNISPHPTDGIGGWSEADFVSAVLRGSSPDGRHYYPAFPYGSYQRMAVADVRDLFAYLKTLPAVAGRQKDHALAFPFSIRQGVGVWKLLYLDSRPFEPEATRSPGWNRGAYLVEGPGHCAECHSPRTALGGIVAAQRFAGGPDPEGGTQPVPNITQHALKGWSVDDFMALLTTGATPEFSTVGGSMGRVIRNIRELPESDRRAMAVYLKSLPAVAGVAARGK